VVKPPRPCGPGVGAPALAVPAEASLRPRGVGLACRPLGGAAPGAGASGRSRGVGLKGAGGCRLGGCCGRGDFLEVGCRAATGTGWPGDCAMLPAGPLSIAGALGRPSRQTGKLGLGAAGLALEESAPPAEASGRNSSSCPGSVSSVASRRLPKSSAGTARSAGPCTGWMSTGSGLPLRSRSSFLEMLMGVAPRDVFFAAVRTSREESRALSSSSSSSSLRDIMR